MKRTRPFLTALTLLAVTAGCGVKQKEITSAQRGEAATLASEAQFALSVREYSRAEGLLAKAVELCPDTGNYWVSLGSTRMRLSQRDAARTAYRQALSAYEGNAAKAPTSPE